MRIEISRRIFHVKRTSILATLLIAISLFSTSCGTGDKIGSVAMQVVGSGTGTVNLAGLGGTLQLQVLAVYTSGKQIDETNFATYTVTPEGFYWTYDNAGNELAQVTMPAPPQGITLNKTGMLTAVDPGICSWVNLGSSSTSAAWAFTGDYMVTATYRGFTSNPVFIPVASAASGANNTNGACGPTATGQ
jgi:hypothetical protein